MKVRLFAALAQKQRDYRGAHDQSDYGMKYTETTLGLSRGLDSTINLTAVASRLG